MCFHNRKQDAKYLAKSAKIIRGVLCGLHCPRLLSAHRVAPDGKLTSLWNINGKYQVSASPAVAPDRDLLYIDNYLAGRDHFVVLRLSTGEELASVPLDANLPTIGTIFLGMNEDVYILKSEAGTPDGRISRIFV